VPTVADELAAVLVERSLATDVRAKLRATRRAGQLISKLDCARPWSRTGKRRTLLELGINPGHAYQWSALAKVSDELFERALRSENPSVQGIVRGTWPRGKKRAVAAAGGLWRALQRYVSKYFWMDPGEIVQELPIARRLEIMDHVTKARTFLGQLEQALSEDVACQSCETCGRPVLPRSYHYKPKRWFCSPGCRHQAYKAREKIRTARSRQHGGARHPDL
jgi:hypothetical protein